MCVFHNDLTALCALLILYLNINIFVFVLKVMISKYIIILGNKTVSIYTNENQTYHSSCFFKIHDVGKPLISSMGGARICNIVEYD